MPEEKDRDGATKEPNPEAVIQPPGKPPADGNLPFQSSGKNPNNNQRATQKLEEDIKSGEQWLIGIGIATLLINSIIALIYWDQLKEMRKATEAASGSVNIAAYALRENQRQFNETLGQMKEQTKAQANAAETAKETLRVSERAYLAIGGLTMSGNPMHLIMPMINTGHIPAKDVSVLVFEETIFSNTNFLEGHWSQFEFKEEIPPGNALYSITTSSGADADEVAKGAQIVTVAGSVEYNYGFPKTPNETTWFCFHSIYDEGVKTSRFMPCDTEAMIPIMKKDIQYPHNHEPTNK